MPPAAESVNTNPPSPAVVLPVAVIATESLIETPPLALGFCVTVIDGEAMFRFTGLLPAFTVRLDELKVPPACVIMPLPWFKLRLPALIEFTVMPLPLSETEPVAPAPPILPALTVPETETVKPLPP